MPRLTIRIDFDDGSALGPGTIRLLELVAETGSIRKAAAGMKMSYRKAWLLHKAHKETCGDALVETTTGGKAGGGERLTRLGRFVGTQYRALEGSARRAAGPAVEGLDGRVRSASRAKTRLRRRIRA